MLSSDVSTIHVDFNSGDNLFDAIKIGDEVWADDGEGLRCRATITEIHMSQYSTDTVMIYAEPNYDTLEDLKDGKWKPRKKK